MLQIRETPSFSEWLEELPDRTARTKIVSRIERLSKGNPGDVAPVGEGVSELRIHFGPGYRVYYQHRGKVLILLLCGGNKSTQDRDIKRAKELASEYED